MIKAGILGATGYAGSELVRILMQHPEVEPHILTARSYIGKGMNEVYRNFEGIMESVCVEEDIEAIAKECDVLFLALPHGIAAKKITSNILDLTKVIDFGGDFRLSDPDVYEKWYGLKHEGRDILPQAQYGLCEIYREKIRNSRLIANPGCYTTCTILALYPLLAEGIIEPSGIITDAKSGVTGAGRSLELTSLYCEVNESIKAYKVAAHRHTPEIEQILSDAAGCEIIMNFTPHLTPMNRGILASSYASLKPGISEEDVAAAYDKFYKNEPFVRLCKKGVLPETKWVKASNYTDIGFTIDKRTNRIIVISALDNLVKGAAGQAVQNMNIIFGLDEKAGLEAVPVFPV
ncbi:MAG: N-acetyl-gamma-glutamyl-phosphate reductase [Firmicutes bacterium]|nr:N-acetyl-gamma-glutamyl-phosphate reductase [Bacillota bacterium]